VKADMTKVDAKALQQMRQEYFQHRLNVMLGKEHDTATLKTMRRNIARASMYLHMNKDK
jgi:ribosomal protein L29